jgi:hypothetical protein
VLAGRWIARRNLPCAVPCDVTAIAAAAAIKR